MPNLFSIKYPFRISICGIGSAQEELKIIRALKPLYLTFQVFPLSGHPKKRKVRDYIPQLE
jgi:hypothetical protein